MEENNKKNIYVKTKNKTNSLSGFGVILLSLIFISLSFYIFMKFIYLLFSGTNTEGNSKNVSNSLLPDIFSNQIFVIVFIIVLIIILILIILNNSKNNDKLLIEIDESKYVKCKKCGSISSIEKEYCSKCGFGANISYLCSNCNVYNNISNTECIKCGEKIDLIDVKKQVQKASYKELTPLIISGILVLILLPSSKSDDLIIPIIFVCLFLNYLIKYIKYYKVIKEIERIITDN